MKIDKKDGPTVVNIQKGSPHLFFAMVINAWYAAQSLHLAEKGEITKEDKFKIFSKVYTQITGFVKLEKGPNREVLKNGQDHEIEDLFLKILQL